MSLTQQDACFLVISAIGSDKPGIVNQLAKACAKNHCNIVDSRMTVLGGEFAVLMMASGSDENIKALEDTIPALSENLGLTTITKRTQPRQLKPAISFTVTVVALDNPGIVHEIANFFSTQHINIDELETGTYAAPHTGTQMFSLNMAITVPPTVRIASLREEFLDFCDNLNLDATLDPTR
ncbi:MAG: glycine cleavage system protein R [Hahellaceae bacterium]|nr:glycine cleavage system protein R [Hahellaceae bacterium]